MIIECTKILGTVSFIQCISVIGVSAQHSYGIKHIIQKVGSEMMIMFGSSNQGTSYISR